MVYLHSFIWSNLNYSCLYCSSHWETKKSGSESQISHWSHYYLATAYPADWWVWGELKHSKWIVSLEQGKKHSSYTWVYLWWDFQGLNPTSSTPKPHLEKPFLPPSPAAYCCCHLQERSHTTSNPLVAKEDMISSSSGLVKAHFNTQMWLCSLFKLVDKSKPIATPSVPKPSQTARKSYFQKWSRFCDRVSKQGLIPALFLQY